MTTQITDKLIYQNKEYYLNDELLEKYFRAFPEKKPETDNMCTALWRGYIATFEIRDNEFFVKEMEVLTDVDFGTASILDKIFPDTKKFEWYSGLIRIDSFRGRFDSEPEDGVFEFLEIRNGDLIQKRVMNFEELQVFKKEQYIYFMMTDDKLPVYQLFKSNNEGITEERINKIIKEYILRYTREVYVD